MEQACDAYTEKEFADKFEISVREAGLNTQPLVSRSGEKLHLVVVQKDSPRSITLSSSGMLTQADVVFKGDRQVRADMERVWHSLR